MEQLEQLEQVEELFAAASPVFDFCQWAADRRHWNDGNILGNVEGGWRGGRGRWKEGYREMI